MQAPSKLPKSLLKELQTETPFTSRELGRLWTRFRALDTDGSGSISGAVRRASDVRSELLLPTLQAQPNTYVLTAKPEGRADDRADDADDVYRTSGTLMNCYSILSRAVSLKYLVTTALAD
jgi:hypothetical protein